MTKLLRSDRGEAHSPIRSPRHLGQLTAMPFAGLRSAPVRAKRMSTGHPAPLPGKCPLMQAWRPPAGRIAQNQRSPEISRLPDSMRKMGLEPTQLESYKILSLARLPVPTLPHFSICGSGCSLSEQPTKIDNTIIFKKMSTTFVQDLFYPAAWLNLFHISGESRDPVKSCL